MREKNFDVFIIGVGTAGQVIAYNTRSWGKRVGIIDNRPFGGTCVLRGCDPKKVLVGAGEAMDWFARMKDNGIIAKDVRIDWQRLMEVKHGFVKDIPSYVEGSLKKAGIETFHGTATFIDQNTVKVQNETIRAKHFVIASGATPVPLGIPGEEYVTISDDFLELKELPKRVVFIGGGFISFEFAHVSRRAGLDVTILHRSQQPLSTFDPDLVNLLVKASEDIGIKVHINTPVVGIEKKGTELVVHAKTKNGGTQTFTADLVVHGGGRIANLSPLQLDKVGVEVGKRGVRVNEYLQSISNPIVFAAGDASEYGLPLTPVAGKEGLVVSTNILRKKKMKADFQGVPSVVFTTPPLASVGISEKEAKEKGLHAKVKFEETSGWYSSRRIHEKFSGYKTLVEEKTGKILGAHLLGHNAEELINIFGLAIKHNIRAKDLDEFIYSYPTHASNIQYMI